MMKKIFVLLFLVSATAYSQQVDYNIQKGFVANGYDVVSYFSNKATKGNSKYTYTYKGAAYKFVSKENLESFKSNTEMYIPQYGGYCAYAIGKNGEKVSINPKTFEIRDGKLYLFYNSWGTNTLEMWTKQGPEALQKKADSTWEKTKFKS